MISSFPALVGNTTLAVFGLTGHWEILIVLAIVLLLFGNRLPGAMRNLGQSFVQFKKGIKDDEDNPDSERDPTA